MCNLPDRAGPVRSAPTGVAASVLVGLIRIYQLTLSFLLGRQCRHLPTCSDYAMEAVRRHGAWAGFWLGFFRVVRCGPGGSHGFDPVPDQVAVHGLRFWAYRDYRHKQTG